MTRLTSIEKAGFYEFPPAYLDALASLFAPSAHGGKLLDPCAGEGRALHHLAQAWNLTAYANELDTARAGECKRLFGPTYAVQGDMFQLRATLGSFPVVWVNPPYSWDSTGDEKRREFGMLKHAWKWAQPGGWVLWCVYGHHITTEAASFLASRSSQVEVWQLPGLHLGEYTHIVVVARVGQPTSDPGKLAIQLVQMQQNKAFPELTVQSIPCYEIPAPVVKKQFIFAPKIITPEISLQAIQEAGAQFGSGFQMLLQPPKSAEKIAPVVRPRGGQLALILAAGMFNGLILDTPGGRAAVRSTVESVETMIQDEAVNEADEHSVEREVYRTQPMVTITLLDEQGIHTDMSGDTAMVNFIKDYKPALMTYLDEHFKPLYNFDYSPLKPILARSKGGKLYQTQKHVIAACYTALQTRKGVLLVGEPGTGKTVMGATLAATMQKHARSGQVTIVTCPPHLVGKWEREIKEAAPGTYVRILKNVEDVRALMDKAAERGNLLTVGVLSRETAKLGEGWSVAVNWKKSYIACWPTNGTPPEGKAAHERIVTLKVPICPSCGATIYKDNSDEPASQGYLERIPRDCKRCGHTLWMKARTFSKGKYLNGNPKNPRVGLAEYIAKRYPGRVYLYLADEIHESKSAATDQGEAMMVLANAARKVVGLTGTLYGGTASGMYAIEFTFNPRVRAKYPWGKGMNQWVQDMGCLERIIEYRPQYDTSGKYSGKRRSENKPKEAPGCSPILVQEIIDHCVFVGLLDMGKKLPTYQEIPVPITPDADLLELYQEAKQKLGFYLFQQKMQGDCSALGMYLQTMLSWPNAPYRNERCIHRKRLDRESEEFTEYCVHSIPGLDENRIFAKEQWLIDMVRQQIADGYGVAVFCRQTGTRDIQPRLQRLLVENVPGAKPFILKGSVAADKREDVLNRQVEAGTNILICNPRLVQTGLDLLAFPKIVFFEDDYSLYVMGQASRRAWRLSQAEDVVCETFYPYYTGLMENQAVELIGRKQQAASLLYGEGGGGLSALSDDGGSLLAALAAEIDADVNVTDLRDLFSQHAHKIDPAESAWFVAEEETAEVVEPVRDIVLEALQECGGRIVEIQDNLTPVTKPAVPKRRKIKSLLDVPEMETSPTWQVSTQRSFFAFGDTPVSKPQNPAAKQPPVQVRQLDLFDLALSA